MSTLLIYSPKCKHSKEVIEFIESKPQLKQMVKYHNVNTMGIPAQYKNQIQSVPTLLTQNQKKLVGNEIIQWFTSLLPVEITNHAFGSSKLGTTSFGGGECSSDSFFNLDQYGQSLQGAITPELEAKIGKNVQEAFNEKPR